jgi:hypothetical protein
LVLKDGLRWGKRLPRLSEGKPRNNKDWLSLRGAKRLRLFCHCEPDRESGQAWQSLYFKKIRFANFFPLKNEIATPPLREARNDKGEDCHGLSFGEPSQ